MMPHNRRQLNNIYLHNRLAVGRMRTLAQNSLYSHAYNVFSIRAEGRHLLRMWSQIGSGAEAARLSCERVLSRADMCRLVTTQVADATEKQAFWAARSYL